MKKSSVTRAVRLIFLLLLLFATIAVYLLLAKTFYPFRPKETQVIQKNIPQSEMPFSIDESYKPILTIKFDANSLKKDWEEKSFNGKTNYSIQTDSGGKSYLKGSSQASCSGLFTHIKIPATTNTWVHWKWRAREFPDRKNPQSLGDRGDDDFAARLYIIFEASNFFKSNIIEYIWDKDLPVGTTADSPYSDKIKLLVVKSGLDGDGVNWNHQLRNPLADYKQLFGKDPKYDMGIVAIMSDSDNTKSKSEADFGLIEFLTKTQT